MYIHLFTLGGFQLTLTQPTFRQLVTLLGKIEKNVGWKIIRQILEALVYIHKRKIIHRDLKPGEFQCFLCTKLISFFELFFMFEYFRYQR